jgi:group I intron endonuclease
MIIYKITHKESGKLYIGQTTQSLTERLWQHSHRSPSQSHRSAIYNAIIKYGIEAFTIEQIDTAISIANLNLLEIKYIAQYNSLSPNGYNLLKGGDNKECHIETKAKISETLKGRPIKNRMNGAPKGRKVSDERKAMISATMTGVSQPWKYKKVLVVETGEVFESVNAAAKALGINRPALSSALINGSRNRKTGFTFKFAEVK